MPLSTTDNDGERAPDRHGCARNLATAATIVFRAGAHISAVALDAIDMAVGLEIALDDYLDNAEPTLTTTEFHLMRHLAARPGRVYTRGQLLELVRGYDDALEQDERTINVHISHIRDKINPIRPCPVTLGR